MNRTGWAVYEITRRALLLGVVVGALGLALKDGGDAEPRMADSRSLPAASQSQAPAPSAAALSSAAVSDRPAA